MGVECDRQETGWGGGCTRVLAAMSELDTTSELPELISVSTDEAEDQEWQLTPRESLSQRTADSEQCWQN